MFEIRGDRRPQGRKKLGAERQAYLDLVARGVSTSEACRLVGVNRKIDHRRQYGRRSKTKGGQQGARRPAVRPSAVSGRYLSLNERIVIADRLREGVSPRTIAAELRRSPGTVRCEVLLKETYDVTLAGDDEPTPMIDRPEIQAVLAATTPREKLTRYAAFARVIGDRTGPLLAKLLAGSRSGDPDLAHFRETINRERLIGATGIVRHLADTGGLRAGLSPERARDIVWTLISPELYELLITDRGWTPDQYEQWLAQTLADALAE